MVELCLRSPNPVPLYFDKEGAEALAKNQEHHLRTKHIDARHHFICKCVAKNVFTVQHIGTKDMVVDMLTKPLSCVLLKSHQALFGLVAGG